MYDNINANQILAYVTRHPLRERAFPGWQNEQILMFTLEHMRDDTILIATFQEQIVGILAYDEQPDNHIMVQTILTSAPGILAMFIGVWKQRCPEAVIVARRHGRRIKYKPSNLLRHLEHTLRKEEINHTPSTVNYATA